MSQPQIIHIITSLNVGGAEQMLTRLLLADPQSKEQTLVVSLTGLGVLGEQLSALGYQIHAFDFQRLSTLSANFGALIRLLKVKKPLMVQTWMYHADFFGGLAARFSGCRNIIWGVRNTSVPINSKMTYGLMRLCALLSYIIPKKIICVANAAKQKHISYGYQARKMLVIPNGFDFASFDPKRVDSSCVRRELGIATSDFIIGCVGRFHLDKGQDILINAVALLKKMPEQKVRFLLVGRGCDTYNSDLLRQIDALGLTDTFLLLGERRDIPECLAAMDVFCMPSRTEGFPNGLGEAMCMGLPCVATRVGDTEVLAGTTVILVAPKDPLALASGLTQIINMPQAQRKSLGFDAARRVREHFSIEKTRDHFNQVYRDMME